MGLRIVLDDRALRRYLEAGITRWPDAAAKQLEKVGRMVYDESQAQVPVGKTRRLIGSATIYVAPHTVTIKYTAPYARIVHFRKRVKHPLGKRLFLSSPLGRGRRILRFAIVQAIQDEMDRPA